jgi:5-methylcytosine-specific restriction endonuclease McrA
MSKQSVYVELAGDQIIRIFRVNSDAYRLSVEHPERVGYVARKVAVEEIRKAVFKRATDDDGITHCEDCGKRIDWFIGHMHERIAKGKGGSVSIENSVALCSRCHLEVEHGDRRFQSSKIKEKE